MIQIRMGMNNVAEEKGGRGWSSNTCRAVAVWQLHRRAPACRAVQAWPETFRRLKPTKPPLRQRGAPALGYPAPSPPRLPTASGAVAAAARAVHRPRRCNCPRMAWNAGHIAHVVVSSERAQALESNSITLIGRACHERKETRGCEGRRRRRRRQQQQQQQQHHHHQNQKQKQKQTNTQSHTHIHTHTHTRTHTHTHTLVTVSGGGEKRREQEGESSRSRGKLPCAGGGTRGVEGGPQSGGAEDQPAS